MINLKLSNKDTNTPKHSHTHTPTLVPLESWSKQVEIHNIARSVRVYVHKVSVNLCQPTSLSLSPSPTLSLSH